MISILSNVTGFYLQCVERVLNNGAKSGKHNTENEYLHCVGKFCSLGDIIGGVKQKLALQQDLRASNQQK